MRRNLAFGLALLILAACDRRETPEPATPPAQERLPPEAAQPPPPEEPAALVGTAWVADAIGDEGDLDNKQSTLEFLEDGRAAGRGGCNRYGGPVQISGNQIRFGELMATKMACDAELMRQEEQFLAALAQAREYRMEDWQLVLLDQAGSPLLRLSTNNDPSS